MPVTDVNKDSDSIIITEDGVTYSQSVRREDQIISFPVSGTDQIINIYRKQSDGNLVVSYIDTNDDKQTTELGEALPLSTVLAMILALG